MAVLESSRPPAQEASAPFGSPRVLGSAALAVLAAGVVAVPLATNPVGLRVALEGHATLAPLAEFERPLTGTTPIGAAALLLAAAWLLLAYLSQRATWWEGLLIVAAGAVTLSRLGNAWLLAVASIVPIARQLTLLQPRWPAVALGCLALATAVVAVSATVRPAPVPAAALEAAAASTVPGNAFTAFEWTTDLQQAAGPGRRVLGAGDPWQIPQSFWTDYQRISLGHTSTIELLDRNRVAVVVLDAGRSQARAADLVRADPHWRVLLDAEGVVVAERRTGS